MRLLPRRKIRADIPATTPAFDDGWVEERAYWLGVMREFYRTNYGLDLHPIQTDATVIAPPANVTEIQRLDKSNPDTFFASGYRCMLDYLTELRDHGATIDRMSNVLEMGAGLGRLLIHLFPFQANLFACDVTPSAVEWARAKLGHRVNVELTGLAPPLPYKNGAFDFVYANSVFTHIPCDLTELWAAELSRVVCPGGFLIFSVFDPNHYFRDTTYRDFHQRFTMAGCHDWNHDRGVHRMTYHSRDYIHATWGSYFQVLEIRPHFRDQTHVICRRNN